MTSFVLDNSVSMRWLLESGKKSDQAYAEAVLDSLLDATAVVPNLWHLEASNVLIGALQRNELNSEEVERFLSQLETLPVQIDSSTARRAFCQPSISDALRSCLFSLPLKPQSFDSSFAVRHYYLVNRLPSHIVQTANHRLRIIEPPNYLWQVHGLPFHDSHFQITHSSVELGTSIHAFDARSQHMHTELIGE